MKKPLTLLTLSLSAVLLSGCLYDDPTHLPPGQYDQSSKSTDSRGTEREVKSSTDVYYDENGNKKATVDQKTTTDPNGLFNKSTTESHETIR